MSGKVGQAQTQVVTTTTTKGGLLQRKCAGCGQHSTAGEECQECGKSKLQRRSANYAEPPQVPSVVHDVLRSSGQPLDTATRTFMEPRFGRDFSRVSAHTPRRPAAAGPTIDSAQSSYE